MRGWEIMTGFGYRMFMTAPLALVLAILIAGGGGHSVRAGFGLLILLYMVPVGHGVGFLGGMGWLLSLPGKLIHWGIFLCTQLFMSMPYITFLEDRPFATLVGMPILAVATMVLIFVAGDNILGGLTSAKVLVCTGLLAFTSGFFAMEKIPYLGISLWFLALILLEVGFYIGMKIVREEAAKAGGNKVIVVDSSYAPPGSYGSVQVLTSA